MIRRVLLAICLLAVGAILFVTLSSPPNVLKPVSYWVVDERTLGAMVIDAPGVPCLIAHVAETDQEVRVTAECQRAVPSPGRSGPFQFNEFVILLQSPLGDRLVFDANGFRADRCANPQCR
jgi:hypothetical protein